MRSRSTPSVRAAAKAKAAFWPLCAPRSARAARKIDRRRGLSARHNAMFADPDVGERRLLPEIAMTRGAPARALQPGIDCAAGLVVDADQRDVGLGDQALLDRRVARKIAVPIEMVGRDVDQQADARRQRGREIDLVGRALDDMRAHGRGRRQIEDRHADIAAHRDVAPRLPQDMGDQRGRRRFAVGAGDGDERRVGRSRGALAGEEFDVADDRNAGRLGAVDRPVRLGMGQRHAGREHEEPKPRQSASARSTSAKPAAAARSRAAGLSSQAATSAPPATSARAVDRPEPPRPNSATLCAAQGLDRRHRHLSFSVERPTIASTKAMIQNRMTICGSDQPSCSK